MSDASRVSEMAFVRMDRPYRPAGTLMSSHARVALRLLRAPARRRRSGDRRGPPARARAPAANAGDDRLGELRSPGRPRVPGLGLDQQVRRGLSGQALLRRLRARQRGGGAGDPPRQGALRRRPRQRPAPRGRAGQHRRLPRAAPARGHHPRPRAGPRRPPHPRDEDQRVGPALRHRRLPRPPRGQPHRHGRGRGAGPRAPPQAHHRGLVGLPTAAGPRALPGDRRRGRRVT